MEGLLRDRKEPLEPSVMHAPNIHGVSRDSVVPGVRLTKKR